MNSGKKDQKQDLINQFLEINRRMYLEAKDPLKCHGIEHHIRVCKMALKFAENCDEAVDDSVLIPACFLHDIAAFYPEKTNYLDHHEVGGQMARQELEKLNYGQDKIEKILDAIVSHGSGSADRKESVEATLLRDADKIDALGTVGVARVIMAETRRNQTLEQIADKWSDDKIDKKFESIKTAEAKAMAKPLYKFSKKFFVDLKNELVKGQK